MNYNVYTRTDRFGEEEYVFKFEWLLQKKAPICLQLRFGKRVVQYNKWWSISNKVKGGFGISYEITSKNRHMYVLDSKVHQIRKVGTCGVISLLFQPQGINSNSTVFRQLRIFI